MVTCELDKDISGEILGWKIPAWQALLLHRVVPSCGGLIIYLIVICFDFALVYERFQNGEDGIGAFFVILMILPATIALVFTLASPPPSLQTDLTAFSVTVQQSDIKWIFMEIVKAVFFPIAALGRYCFQIFWWVEAVCASRVQDDERIREALATVREPSSVELYLFLQAFVHSAPFTIVNMLDLMARYSGLTYDNISVQAVSIIAATLRMASTATIYRRFEREKLCGRKYPWQKVSTFETDIVNNKNKTKTQEHVDENIYESITKRESSVSEASEENSRIKTNSDLLHFSPRNTATSSVFYDDVESDLSSDYMPPLSPPRNRKWSYSQDSDEEYVRPVSIIDRVAPRRRDTEYTIEKVNITPPPAIPAPRPGSIAVWAEKLVENAESIPAWLSAPPRRKYCDEVVQDEPDLPRRVPRSYMRGLEPQDLTAALVHYLGWYAFFVARLLSIACFINFSIFISTIILFSHYQIMLLFLIVPQASTVKRGFYVFLAFIYLFCLMEFKIRFRHVRVWHVFWIILCTIESLVFTGIWVSVDNTMHDWWRSFIVKVILGSMTLSYMCFLVYFLLLQPRETIVYIKPQKTAP